MSQLWHTFIFTSDSDKNCRLIRRIIKAFDCVSVALKRIISLFPGRILKQIWLQIRSVIQIHPGLSVPPPAAISGSAEGLLCHGRTKAALSLSAASLSSVTFTFAAMRPLPQLIHSQKQKPTPAAECRPPPSPHRAPNMSANSWVERSHPPSMCWCSCQNSSFHLRQI